MPPRFRAWAASRTTPVVREANLSVPASEKPASKPTLAAAGNQARVESQSINLALFFRIEPENDHNACWIERPSFDSAAPPTIDELLQVTS
jgi:hypothetical protein